MKTFFSLCFFFCLITCSGQVIPPPSNSEPPEFGVSDNGLIYSNQTLRQLKHIVDSLNLKFRQCELHKTYLSLEQGRGHYIEIDKKDISLAITDIKNGVPFETFLKKYPKTKVHKDLLVVRSSYKNYKDVTIVEYFTPNLGGLYFDVEFDTDGSGKEIVIGKNGWKFMYGKATEYSEQSLNGFFLVDELKAKPLEEKMARMVQYSNCMVDTTTKIFLNDADDPWDLKSNNQINSFITYADKQTGRPVYKMNDKTYEARISHWDSTRFLILDRLSTSDQFRKLFSAALNAAITTGASSDEFEEYVRRYKNAETALELKRRRKVMGMCSQDDGPRVHALNIAKLSAEAVKWEVFLRAHLDIMNDRFERASDGSYAWAARKTYLREIEVLDIDVITLLLGISLRISNGGENHYFGSIGRVGRALAETQTPELLENKLLSMIRDPGLDEYNRILMIYLFDNYNYNLTDKVKQEKNIAALKSAVSTLPAYIVAQFNMAKLGLED